MTDKARYEASKLLAYHPCRIVLLAEDGNVRTIHQFQSVQACEASAENLRQAGFMPVVEL